MDTPCIPQDHQLRAETIANINDMFAHSRVTLVCDRDSMDIEIDEAPDKVKVYETLIVVLLVCDWNLRVWTLLESMRGSRKASVADHKATRKSSQGHIFFMFRGPIDWKATLQRSVTKSTTEAELLAASSAGTELIWWWRVFEHINSNPNHERLLYCDNQQKIRLLTSNTPRFKITVRHVDIHHHWLR
jgi:hypothetical protein